MKLWTDCWFSHIQTVSYLSYSNWVTILLGTNDINPTFLTNCQFIWFHGPHIVALTPCKISIPVPTLQFYQDNSFCLKSKPIGLLKATRSVIDIWPWSFWIHGNLPWKQHIGSPSPKSLFKKYNKFLKKLKNNSIYIRVRGF